MIDCNEPPFIKYEEILLPDEEPRSEETDESSESDSEEEMELDESFFTSANETELPEDRANRIRLETIGRILDAVFVPRKFRKDDKTYLVRLSRQPASRDDAIELSEKFEKVMKERQVRMKGFCPVRRELFDLLFDELIRESTIHCPERGSLLLRVRDEFRMTLDAHERLFESGVTYGVRTTVEAEAERKSVETQYKQLEEEVSRAEKRVADLRAEMDADETESRQRAESRQARHEERMDFLRKLNSQLKEQISYIRPG